MGGEIHIGEDCWLGGNVIVLPGIKIGQGCTIGAGSVVTKVRLFSSSDFMSFCRLTILLQDVPPYKVVAGNPARIIKDAPRGTKAEVTSGALAALEADRAAASLPRDRL